MRIRSALGALFAALALIVGLVASAGTASAGVPAFGGHGHGPSCTPAAGSTSCTPVTPGGHTLPACTVVAPALTCSDPFHPHFPGGGFPGGLGNNGLLGLGGLNLLNGNTIILGDGEQVDVCQYPQWTPFYQHFGNHFGGMREQLNQIRYEQLLAQAGCGASNGSLNGLTLINGNLINLGSYGVLGGNTVNVCDYSDYNQFDQFGEHRFGGNFNGFHSRFGGFLGGGGGWSRLRHQANCGPQIVVVPGSDTTTVVQVPPAPVTQAAPAPAATPEAAPAPLQSSGNYHYPASAPDTGN